MRLTKRDAIATLLCAAAVLVAIQVESPRLATIVLGAIGMTMCAVGTRAEDMATRETLLQHPATVLGATLGIAALALIVAGLLLGSTAIVGALTTVIVLAWAVATTRHALTPAAHTTAA
jgi:Na+-transporting NADH:ubiquinone oxidoreductase subunit NqrD